MLGPVGGALGLGYSVLGEEIGDFSQEPNNDPVFTGMWENHLLGIEEIWTQQSTILFRSSSPVLCSDLVEQHDI